jgi:hypothetical protein
MAARGTLEVEHLLRAAKSGTPGFAAQLDALSREMGWPTEIPDGDTSDTIPICFGAWARVVSMYARGGFDGLRSIALEHGYLDLVLALAEELRTPAALAFVLAVGADLLAQPDADFHRSTALASTLNILLRLPSLAVFLGPDQASLVREFLHTLARRAPSDNVRGTAYCALRYVGDAETLRLLEALPRLGGEWAQAQEACKRGVAKRLKQAKV